MKNIFVALLAGIALLLAFATFEVWKSNIDQTKPVANHEFSRFYTR